MLLSRFHATAATGAVWFVVFAATSGVVVKFVKSNATAV